MAGRTGRNAMLEQFVADGIEYMFGNPGTVEQGLLDALADFPQIKYILTLQESVAVLAADGYARATRKPALVQLHSSPGLGNGVGALYQAKRGHTPLLVIAGEAGVTYDAFDAQMAADLVAIAAPVTKWATRVTHPSSVLRVIRRAYKMAATPPTGPVFVALPADVLNAPADEDVVPTVIPQTRVAPAPDLVAQAASMLAGATLPIIIMGDGVAQSDAQPELERVAETIGAEVWGANSSEVNIRADHPLFRGHLGHMFGDISRQITRRADVVLIVGTYVFPEVFPALHGVFAAGARVIHIDLDAYEIAKNFPVDLGLVADPKLTLEALAEALHRTMTRAQARAASQRVSALAQQKEKEVAQQRQADAAVRDQVPLHASRFMAELASKLPSEVYVFDEALTTSPEVVRYLPPVQPGHYFQTRGGSLGVGVPGAIGVKLAHPDKTVVGFSGDGGSMYTIQALWTAAHHNIGAKFIICNNASYRILKLNVQQYWKDIDTTERDFPAPFDIKQPEIRFDELARGMGVPSTRVEKPDQIGPAISKALERDGPYLIDLVISGAVPEHFVYIHCGQ